MSKAISGFSLNHQTGKLVNINIRTEKHGDKDVIAVDLKLVVPIPNMQLAEFHPQLRHALYENKEKPQVEIIPVEPINLKFPQMAPFKWELEMKPCDFSIHWGITDKTDIILSETVAGEFKMAPQEGGTVELHLRVQANPTSEQVGNYLV